MYTSDHLQPYVETLCKDLAAILYKEEVDTQLVFIHTLGGPKMLAEIHKSWRVKQDAQEEAAKRL